VDGRDAERFRTRAAIEIEIPDLPWVAQLACEILVAPVGRDDLSAPEACLSGKGRPRRFQFSMLDLAILLALHAVAISATLELYRSWSTDSTPDYSGGLRQIGGPPRPPPPPEAPVVAVIGGGMRFTAFWLRRFAGCVIVGSLAILISFFGIALLLKNANQHVRPAGPRLAAALVCLLFVVALSGFTYICHSPESYIEIQGHRIHPVVHAAWWAVGPAVAVTCVIVLIEIAGYIRAGRRLRSNNCASQDRASAGSA